MSARPIPLLVEDGTRLDWQDAQYEPQIERRGAEQQVAVHHELKGATSLADAVRRGEATWQTEVRCPRLLFSAHFDSLDDRQTVEWPADSVDWENTYLLPGMASLGMTLRPSDELIVAARAEEEGIDIPPGALLARADVRRLKPLMQSLLVFRKDNELGNGQMRVEEDTTSDDPCYIVRFAADIFAESRWARDRRIAALIGAFAAMARSDSRMQHGGDLEHHPVARELRSRLLAAGSPTWEEDEFECAFAATLIEPLLEQTPNDDDGEDE